MLIKKAFPEWRKASNICTKFYTIDYFLLSFIPVVIIIVIEIVLISIVVDYDFSNILQFFLKNQDLFKLF